MRSCSTLLASRQYFVTSRDQGSESPSKLVGLILTPEAPKIFEYSNKVLPNSGLACAFRALRLFRTYIGLGLSEGL